ncbi:MAG: hypothetical protein H3C53_02175 [Trueperaceae bacterium]|nr:hypothetical protein [Trueperaceae bacterium]
MLTVTNSSPKSVHARATRRWTAAAMLLAAVLFGALAFAQPSANRLVFASNLEPGSIDPSLMSGQVNEAEVIAQIYETLVYLSADHEFVPGLATSWSASDDATTWTFTIRQGVKFHNGDPLTAQNVADQFTFAQDAPDLVGGTWGRLVDVVKSVAVNGNDVVVTLNTPRPDFLVELAGPSFSISNIAYVKAVGREAGYQPVGTGPFVFKEWVNGSHITLVRNPDWTWGSSLISDGGPAKLDEVVFRFIPEAQTRLATLESGETQFVDLVPFGDIVRLRDSDAFAVTGFQLPGMPQMNYLNTSIAPTNELAVRQAINYAVDKQAIVDTVYFGMTEPAYGPLSNVFPEYDPSLESMYPFDPEKAEQLLTDAGWVDANGDGVREKDGKPLQVVLVENKGWNDWVYLMQAYLQDVGFDASVLTTQGPSNTAAIASGEYAVPAMGDVFATASLMTKDWNRAGYGTFPSSHFWEGPELDDMLYAAEVETNPEERIAKYREIQQFIMKEALMVPIFELYFYAAHDKALVDFVVDGTGYYKYFGKARYAN